MRDTPGGVAGECGRGGQRGQGGQVGRPRRPQLSACDGVAEQVAVPGVACRRSPRHVQLAGPARRHLHVARRLRRRCRNTCTSWLSKLCHRLSVNFRYHLVLVCDTIFGECKLRYTFFLSLNNDRFRVRAAVDLIDCGDADHVSGVRFKVAQQSLVVNVAFFSKSEKI